MAIRIQNANTLTFASNLTSAVTVTHFRARRASDDQASIVVAFPTPLAYQAGQDIVLPGGALDFVYVAGHMGNTHMQVLVESFWGAGASLGMELDLLTNVNTVVADPQYSRQQTAGWALTIEDDP